MTVRLDQNTKLDKWEMSYEIQTYALYESIMIVLHFNGTNSEWVQSLVKYLLCCEPTGKRI